ncbi:hypothetical protein ABXT08_08215 [Chryseobacterium sp. NRRL B-14859]|uniref:hypothetical protein n=1 Tax=Chryseobacterium sp. NRRL B-14859 TaxID=1562763 RepID=UPI003394CA4F
MLSKWFLLVILFFAFKKSLAQNTDGLRLNVRLYPVQTLTIHTTSPDNGYEASPNELQSVTISSLSGFQVKASYGNEPSTLSADSLVNPTDEYNLINRRKGVVQRTYTINKDIENPIKKFDSNPAEEQTFLTLTLISL